MSDPPIHVLLIEDDEDDYTLTREFLGAITAVEFTIDWEATYDRGRTALLSDRYDVCLIDYRLGQRSGLDLLQEAGEAGCRAPLIVLTAANDRQTDIEAMKSGAADYLVKEQINPALLERSIRYAIERKRGELKLREVAELNNAIQAKDRFLASITHELRTPLNAVIGFAGTLLLRLPGPLTTEQERQLRIIQSNSKYVMSLINDLLDLAKIDSGKVELKPELIRLADLQHQVVEMLRVLAVSKGLTLDSSLADGDLTLQTDRRMLAQILINLTSNAIKYTEAGGVRIESGLAAGDPSLIAISVVDTGIGIKPEDKEKLFQPFQRLGGQRTCRQEGSGLGLHLSGKMAAVLGGRIQLESEYGKGSRFTLEIPKYAKCLK